MHCIEYALSGFHQHFIRTQFKQTQNQSGVVVRSSNPALPANLLMLHCTLSVEPDCDEIQSVDLRNLKMMIIYLFIFSCKYHCFYNANQIKAVKM